jgi:hypothetical protein
VSAVAEATGWYVYGVVASSHAGDVGTPAVKQGQVAALVAEVPLSEYGEDVLPDRLNDRAWLEAHVQRHQDVLQSVAAAAPVVPFRFGTIYREVDDVRAMLGSREAQLTAALSHVAGRVEMGVKAWVAHDHAEASRARSAPPAPTGRAYLEQRLGARDSARDAAALLADAAADAHGRLLAIAVEGVANRPQARELTGRDELMILNGAYLVEDAGALRREVERLASEYGDRGITFELTGPWPPYNFAAVGGEA